MDLSTRPEKSVGSDEIWEAAESALKEALETKGWAYDLNEADGAFYGELEVCLGTTAHAMTMLLPKPARED